MNVGQTLLLDEYQKQAERVLGVPNLVEATVFLAASTGHIAKDTMDLIVQHNGVLPDSERTKVAKSLGTVILAAACAANALGMKLSWVAERSLEKQ